MILKQFDCYGADRETGIFKILLKAIRHLPTEYRKGVKAGNVNKCCCFSAIISGRQKNHRSSRWFFVFLAKSSYLVFCLRSVKISLLLCTDLLGSKRSQRYSCEHSTEHQYLLCLTYSCCKYIHPNRRYRPPRSVQPNSFGSLIRWTSVPHRSRR